MVDEESQDVASEPSAGAPINRDKRRDPEIIEGEVAAEPAPEPPAAERSSAAAPPPPATPARGARNRAAAFVAGLIGGLVAAALAEGVGAYLFPPKVDLASLNLGRIAALEAEARRDGATLAAQAERESAALSALDKRVGALEATSRTSASHPASAETTQNLATQVKDLSGALEAARGDIAGLAARIDKLETRGPQTGGASPDLSSIVNRLDKIEASLAAPKSETRAAREARPAADNSAAIAIVAEAVDQKLAAGQPFAPEINALKSLGVDPAALSALNAVADGPPTDEALAASFAALAPKVLAATLRPERGGVVDRLLAHMRGLVLIRDLNETVGDDPPALVSQIEAQSRRGDLAGALAAFEKLPEAARQAAGGWPAEAHARLAAEAAAQSIREAAVGRLAGERP